MDKLEGIVKDMGGASWSARVTRENIGIKNREEVPYKDPCITH